ncbi:acyl-CoA/acyl-ACP dehydrogenase [Nonomuraea sp. NBC_01738]|uniref:acyl-CoA dehydrogenase family protein n=1 Tax=Nonomuraea sp. NBC_01738 TaxID=2976003 RepID=UPI002E15A3D7|nr:acyl-CoA/acyl-ACP dehydrogenase [Nonomuraea sp. NBC_01738]
MKLVLSQEQQDLRAAVRAFLAAASPLSQVRADMESADGYSREVYARLSGELGLPGLIVAEEYGGAGAGQAELAVVLEETGAALLPGPFLAQSLAAIALTTADDKELLPAIAEGGLVVTTASSTDRVPNGMDASVILLDTGDALLAVQGSDVRREARESLDLTRRQARITLGGAATRVVTDDPATLAVIRDRQAVALAAEQLGVIRACLEAIVAYAKVRVAFGRYIGSYQGVKHKLADMHGKLEQGESIVRYAAWAADESPADLPEAAALAQAYLGRACFEVARDHLLLHGGIGFTWEHDAHLYYKRAKADEVLLGPPRDHRVRLAELLEL